VLAAANTVQMAPKLHCQGAHQLPRALPPPSELCKSSESFASPGRQFAPPPPPVHVTMSAPGCCQSGTPSARRHTRLGHRRVSAPSAYRHSLIALVPAPSLPSKATSDDRTLQVTPPSSGSNSSGGAMSQSTSSRLGHLRPH
jgi:hypothetical protein